MYIYWAKFTNSTVHKQGFFLRDKEVYFQVDYSTPSAPQNTNLAQALLHFSAQSDSEAFHPHKDACGEHQGDKEDHSYDNALVR